MTDSQRDRAEAAFGHMQHAAKEMILAAHDALEMLDEAVTTAGVAKILNRLDDLRRSVFTRPGPTRTKGPAAVAPDDPGSAAAPDDPPLPTTPAATPGPTRSRNHSRVERIPVR
jgi:hypothetical protein